ncbi:MAG: response regulator [Bacteroidales bacterium]|nr:response regulator [Bacteroidales bacterium]
MNTNSGKKRIVIAEDTLTQAIKLRHLLEINGYEIYHAINGQKAIELIKENNPQLIISDLLMPVMGGYELCKWCKSTPQFSEIPFVLLTTLNDVQDLVQGLNSEANGYLIKPCPDKLLLNKLENLLSTNPTDIYTDKGNLIIKHNNNYFEIKNDSKKIFDFLISAYETSIIQKNELGNAHMQLEKHSRTLEKTVKERTKELQREIDERKEIEFELQEAKTKAENNDKLKSIFLSNMSHDLRTPINAVIGFAELLKDEVDESLKFDFLDMIIKNSESLLHLVNDIIDLSKIEAGQLDLNVKGCNIYQIVSELFKQFNNLITLSPNKNITLVKNIGIEEHDLLIETDPLRVKQILSNLIHNATKFTQNGFIEFGYEIIPDDKLLFYVKDTGTGIRKQDQNSLFQRFSQPKTSDNYQEMGTGLGLAISKNLVELLGGKIWFDSKYQSGSTFYFTIPFKTIKGKFTDHFPKMDITEKSYNFKDKTILIVEDNYSNYRYLSSVLDKADVSILYAKDGLNCLEFVRDHEEIDLVLMDIHLPLLNGLDATKEIKKIRSNLPVVAQTAFAMSFEEQMCYDAGCDGYLSKPIRPATLLEKISEFIS